MGLIRAAAASVGGTLADQWLETIEPRQVDNQILATYGVQVRKNDSRNRNRKGTSDVISNGSIIHVPENTFMLLVDGGKIISATDTPGYYQVDNSRAPSLFFKSADGTSVSGYENTGRGGIERPGGLVNTITDSWERFKHGGGTPVKQSVIYINKMEIPSLRFGTRNPVSYTDRTLVPGRIVPCKVTSHGTYSIKIENPLLFYAEVVPKSEIANKDLTSSDLGEQYVNEFLMAYTTALSSLSLQNITVTDIPIETMRLGQEMAKVLDDEWLMKRGFAIHSVGIAGISFDEKTDKLLEQYGSDSILFDPNARAARMTAGLAEGLQSAGSNEGGAMLGFAGMSMGMNAASAMGAMPNQQAPQQPAPQAPQPPQSPQQAQQAPQQAQQGAPVNVRHCASCGEGMAADAAFCSNCGAKAPSNNWTCSCGNVTDSPFCAKCGSKKPEESAPATYKCDKCDWVPDDPQNPPAFCPNCGDRFDDEDKE